MISIRAHSCLAQQSDGPSHETGDGSARELYILTVKALDQSRDDLSRIPVVIYQCFRDLVSIKLEIKEPISTA